MGVYNNKPVCFISIHKFPNKFSKEMYKISRVVIIPEFQKLKINNNFINFIIDNYYLDKDVRLTTSHKIMLNILNKSKNFILKAQYLNAPDYGSKTQQKTRKCYMETYQYKNNSLKNFKITRVNIPKNMIKK